MTANVPTHKMALPSVRHRLPRFENHFPFVSKGPV